MESARKLPGRCAGVQPITSGGELAFAGVRESGGERDDFPAGLSASRGPRRGAVAG